jgi:hypothetical protein
MINIATADPNNAIAETNEADNQSLPVTHTNTCDTQVDKFQLVDVVETHSGPGNQQYFLQLSDVAAGQTQYAASTVSDTLPAGFVVQGAPTLPGTFTGTCSVTGTPPAAQTVTCTNVSGPNTSGILINVQVPTSVVRGNYDNTATVTTPGDVNGANNASTTTTTVYPFDVVVTNVATVGSTTAGNQYAYQITVNNVSAGGHASGPFFINGGLFLRNSTAPGDSFGSAAAFAVIPVGGVSSANVGVTCTFPSGSGGGADQRYSCLINNIAAGGNVVISVLVNALAAEADGAEEVSLDANATNSAGFLPCSGGGLAAGCAPETTGFAPTNTPLFSTGVLANNRVAVLTDID